MVRKFENSFESLENGRNGGAEKWQNMVEEFERDKRISEKHEKKVIKALLTGESRRYIGGGGNFELSENERDEFYERRNNGEITDEDEKGVIAIVARPIDRLEMFYQDEGMSKKESKEMAQVQVFGKIGENKHFKKILGYFTEKGFEKGEETEVRDLGVFLGKYETPMDFDKGAEYFLEQIRGGNSRDKYEEYVRDMAGFRNIIYGNQERYFRDIQVLNEKAEAERRLRFGVSEMSKAETRGKMDGEPSKDAAFCDVENGVFAVFDGAGSHKGARKASQIGKETIGEYLANSGEIETIDNLKGAMERANRRILEEAEGGQTTGTIVKIGKKENGKRKLIFASIGDSRLYLSRDGKTEQLTTDDGITEDMLDDRGIHDPELRENYLAHGISKCLGMAIGVEISDGNFGMVDLKEGDRLVLCSDGVTGDIEAEKMTNEEIFGILGEFENDDAAAGELVRRARKNDDRTAIVVTV